MCRSYSQNLQTCWVYDVMAWGVATLQLPVVEIHVTVKYATCQLSVSLFTWFVQSYMHVYKINCMTIGHPRKPLDYVHFDKYRISPKERPIVRPNHTYCCGRDMNRTASAQNCQQLPFLFTEIICCMRHLMHYGKKVPWLASVSKN